jgi:hypothetical protein
MATPMEYDVLREYYWAVMAMLNNLTHNFNIQKEDYRNDKTQLETIWQNEIQGINFDEINYDKVLAKLQTISKPWQDLNNRLYEERKNAPVFLDDDIELEVPTFIKF